MLQSMPFGSRALVVLIVASVAIPITNPAGAQSSQVDPTDLALKVLGHASNSVNTIIAVSGLLLALFAIITGIAVVLLGRWSHCTTLLLRARASDGLNDSILQMESSRVPPSSRHSHAHAIVSP